MINHKLRFGKRNEGGFLHIVENCLFVIAKK